MKLKDKVLKKPLPNHIAIILDGNGRWAKKRGLQRKRGHQQGAMTLKNIVIEAYDLGVGVLSVFAFSTENWKRPQEEVDFLMDLPRQYEQELNQEFKGKDLNIRIMFSGRRDRFSEENIALMERLENSTKDHDGLIFNICVDYGSKDEITNATKTIAEEVKKNKLNPKDISESTIEQYLYTHPLPPVDLLIRTSGEQRISNFLLWQAAYAEFYFTTIHWPAFNKRALHKAIKNYQERNRRFGGLRG